MTLVTYDSFPQSDTSLNDALAEFMQLYVSWAFQVYSETKKGLGKLPGIGSFDGEAAVSKLLNLNPFYRAAKAAATPPPPRARRVLTSSMVDPLADWLALPAFYQDCGQPECGLRRYRGKSDMFRAQRRQHAPIWPLA